MSAAGTHTPLSAAVVAELGQALLDAFERGEPIEPLTDQHPNLSVTDAYRIQQELMAGHRRLGRAARGRKIGLTSLPMQRQLGIDSPDFGVLLDTHTFPSGATLSRSELGMIAPKLEPEVAIVLGAPLPGGSVTAADVRGATSQLVAVMEIIDSRVRDWRITLVDTVADNASCFGAVAGEARPRDAAGEPHRLSVELSRDGHVEQRGSGDAVMGDPFQAVAWLANELHRHGASLPPGELILSGSFTAAVDAVPGLYTADFGAALGSVTVQVIP